MFSKFCNEGQNSILKQFIHWWIGNRPTPIVEAFAKNSNDWLAYLWICLRQPRGRVTATSSAADCHETECFLLTDIINLCRLAAYHTSRAIMKNVSMLLIVTLFALLISVEDSSASSVRHHKYCIIGAGPGGLQVAYFLQKNKRDYIVFEKGSGVGEFSFVTGIGSLTIFDLI